MGRSPPPKHTHIFPQLMVFNCSPSHCIWLPSKLEDGEVSPYNSSRCARLYHMVVNGPIDFEQTSIIAFSIRYVVRNVPNHHGALLRCISQHRFQMNRWVLKESLALRKGVPHDFVLRRSSAPYTSMQNVTRLLSVKVFMSCVIHSTLQNKSRCMP